MVALVPAEQATKPTSSEWQRLREENDALRALIVELQQQIAAAEAQNQALLEERERAFEAQLEEQTEEIRVLYSRLQDLQEKAADVPARKRRSEHTAWLEVLEAERCQLEEDWQALEVDRRQLRAEEEAMMSRMQEMELQMSRSRAALARESQEVRELFKQVQGERERGAQHGSGPSLRRG